jgi:hypothetical protein
MQTPSWFRRRVERLIDGSKATRSTAIFDRLKLVFEVGKEPSVANLRTDHHYDPHRVMVISTWQTVEDWIRWQESGERARNEAQLEALLGQPTSYEIYNVGGAS